MSKSDDDDDDILKSKAANTSHMYICTSSIQNKTEPMPTVG